jgi:hypothetical protein
MVGTRLTFLVVTADLAACKAFLSFLYPHTSPNGWLQY